MALPFAYLAVALSLLSALIALPAARYPALMRMGGFALLGAAGLCALTAGALALSTTAVEHAQLPLGLPWLHWHLRVDALGGFFLLLIGTIVGAVALYGPAYVREFEHGPAPLSVLGLFSGLFVAGMITVVIADDALSFMVAWEVMSLASYFLVGYQHEDAANRRAAFIYLLMAHVGALSILLAYGVLAAHGAGFTFDAMRHAALTPLWAALAFGLALFGFGMKAGLIPLHAWLPEAHPAAPSFISALMSGVMLKVAVYGLVRFTFDLLGEIQLSWGVVTLILGSASALFGVLYALSQHDLKRLLAYHSVENIGIIFIGLGLSMIFFGAHHPVLGRLGLMAALYHCLNHAVFKSLLFLGAGAVLQHAHERDLERMGGLIHRMPQTALFFLIGCISISALPPFNGFVSEWLTFQTALQAPVLDNGVLRILIPISAAVLALSGALAAACFVKVYGVAFLGQARSRHVRSAREAAPGMRLAQGVLASLCLALGVLPTVFIQWFNSVPTLLFGAGLPSAASQGWLWLTPVAPQVASYGAPLVLLGIAAAWGAGYWVLQRRGAQTPRRAAPWDCGFGPLTPRMQYTATAFSMPIRRIFGPVWHLEETVERETPTGEGPPAGLRYRLVVGDRLWRGLYEPIGRFVGWSARHLGTLQGGNIRIYLAYTFFTLLVLLWLTT
ncbi:MAG TPA: hydrogenase 4 subunit B [Gammaproteobacteria bacterium]|nr:hydrogenase 4 subunit B [Gammaproteobacteria bacterium]